MLLAGNSAPRGGSGGVDRSVQHVHSLPISARMVPMTTSLCIINAIGTTIRLIVPSETSALLRITIGDAVLLVFGGGGTKNALTHHPLVLRRSVRHRKGDGVGQRKNHQLLHKLFIRSGAPSLRRGLHILIILFRIHLLGADTDGSAVIAPRGKGSRRERAPCGSKDRGGAQIRISGVVKGREAISVGNLAQKTTGKGHKTFCRLCREGGRQVRIIITATWPINICSIIAAAETNAAAPSDPLQQPPDRVRHSPRQEQVRHRLPFAVSPLEQIKDICEG